MFARLVAARPTVSLTSTATAKSASTTTHAAQQHVRAFSFFSSKSGGGGDGNGNKYKYFTANSSSSRRSSPPNGASGGGGNEGAASSKPKMDGNTTTATTVGAASPTESADATTTPKSQHPEDATKKGDSSPSTTPSASVSSSAIPNQGWTTGWQPQPMHATLTQKDINLHSFFSGHRPLLSLSQPSSSVFESWPELRLSNIPDPVASQNQSLLSQLGGINLEDPPEATPEADADAARLLNRALVVNKLGGAARWEDTLAKFGFVEDRMGFVEMGMGAHDIADVDAPIMDGFDAYMDSTKRKKRRKMKKHKLKKRRRLQRSQRIKIGK